MLASASSRADEKADKKEETKPQPPTVAFTLPLAIPAAELKRIQIRGRHLTNVTEIRFTNAPLQLHLQIKSQARADVPKESDAKKAGDTVLELELLFPPEAAGTTNWFVAVNPEGSSEPKPLIVLAPGTLIEEKEPNGGFKTAQNIRGGQTMAGCIKESGDVDVFRFQGKRGQTVRAEIAAASLGSSLDSSISLSDARGHTLATADDGDLGPDSLLSFRLAADGDYFLTVIDAQDKGGVTHPYLLRLSTVP